MCIWTHTTKQMLLRNNRKRRTHQRTQEVPEINVEQPPIINEHEVVQMTVPNTQEVGHHAVARTAAHKVVEHVGLEPKWAAGVGVELHEVLDDGAVLCKDTREGMASGHALDDAVVCAGSQHPAVVGGWVGGGAAGGQDLCYE